MNKDTNSTRRSFLKNGAVLAAPIVAATPAAVLADDGLRARLARLENEAAIRELHHAWLRRINAGDAKAAASMFAGNEAIPMEQAVRSIAADQTGEPDTVEISADGKSAVGHFACAVEIETSIPQDSTLAQMAHAQGSGFVRWTERRVLKVEYVKANGDWVIARTEFASI